MSVKRPGPQWPEVRILLAALSNMSKSWKEEDLIQAVNSSTSYSEVLTKLGLKIRSGNYITIRKYVAILNISVTHLTGKTKKQINRKLPRRSNEDIFVENSTYSPSKLFNRLKTLNLPEECSICGLLPLWQDKYLKFHVDHINGVNTDHRLENLRFLCPNCHSQTSTYAGRNNKLSKLIK